MRHKCEQTCPTLHPPVPNPAPATAHTVWSRGEIERTVNPSGGFFSLLARHVLEQGGAMFGTALDEGMTIRHVRAHTVKGLAPMWGSKYVQSDLDGSSSQVKTLLEEETAVLFSGVSCQVNGLKRCLEKNYLNLLVCDLVCHGVSSPAILRTYLDGLGVVRGSKVVSMRFKDKSHGRSHPWLTAQFADRSVYIEDFNRTGYSRGFGMQLFLHPACVRCRYTSTSRPADFTLADYWGLGEKLTLPMERDKGISMVLVNSARRQAVFDALPSRLGQVECPLAEVVAGNPRLASPLKANPRRVVFSAALAALPLAETEKRFLVFPPLSYRVIAKVLIPTMKEKIRKLLK